MIDWLGEPVSLIGVWLIAGPPYLLLWWWTRPEKPAALTGLLAWARDTTEKPTPIEAPADTDPPTVPIVLPAHAAAIYGRHAHREEPTR